ncbi:MAG: CHAD domain-containing protein [Limisphaerales bacterium]
MSTTARRFGTDGPDSMSGAPSPADLPANSLRLLEQSLKKQWKGYRKQLKRCQRRFTEETIHDSRVGARRLLSTVELLGGFLSAARVRKVERALKEHLGTFESLRDTQVQLSLLGKLERAFPAASPLFAFLQKREIRLTKSTRKNIKKVGTNRLDRLIASCREEIQIRRKKCPPGKTVARVLRSVDRAFGRAEELRAGIDPHDTDTIHRARVAFKKFRYMVETLVSCLPVPAPKIVEAMRHYQTMMGHIQDAEMLRLAFEKFLRKHPLPAVPARRLGEELLLRRQRLIDTYMGVSDQMGRFWPSIGLPGATAASAAKTAKATSRSL